jgi:hypothetical protein
MKNKSEKRGMLAGAFYQAGIRWLEGAFSLSRWEREQPLGAFVKFERFGAEGSHK